MLEHLTGYVMTFTEALDLANQAVMTILFTVCTHTEPTVLTSIPNLY